MPQVYADDTLTIECLPALGRLANNCYLLRPTGAPPIVVDVPEGFEAVLAALGDDCARVSHVIVTHSHFDHWGGFDVMRGRIAAPVYCGAAETGLDPARQVRPLADGAVITAGRATLRVLHTPGHTPGSICLLAGAGEGTGGAVLTGDTLFPGGPGYSRSPEALRQEIASITARLHTLPDRMLVLPGHGAGTTIGASRAEYAAFAARAHAPGLHGDVLWATS